MQKWKSPPKAKVYEALSAVADGRVQIVSDNEAVVTSSSGEKQYKVRWDWERNAIQSSDKASVFQGYIGYPIIAVLLQLGRLTMDRAVADALKGVNWNELNKKFKRDYERAVEHVLDCRGIVGEARVGLSRAVDDLYEQLLALDLNRGG